MLVARTMGGGKVEERAVMVLMESWKTTFCLVVTVACPAGHDHEGEASPDAESKENTKLANMRIQFSMLEDQLLDTLREALQPK